MVTRQTLASVFVARLLEQEAAGLDRDEAFAETFREFEEPREGAP